MRLVQDLIQGPGLIPDQDAIAVPDLTSGPTRDLIPVPIQDPIPAQIQDLIRDPTLAPGADSSEYEI